MPRLRRERDGAGDSGAMIQLFRLGPDGEIESKIPKSIEEVTVGWAVRVGSITARSYSYQDYWTTTPITEIIEQSVTDDGDDYIKFRTGNSVYTLEY